VKEDEVGRACSTNWVKRNAYRILVGKRPLGRLRGRWVDHIKMDLRETGWGGTGWIDLVQDRDQWSALLNIVMNLQVPQNAKFLSSCTIGSFSRMAQLHEVSKYSDTELVCLKICGVDKKKKKDTQQDANNKDNFAVLISCTQRYFISF
jgi:hypothetical protein